MRHAVDDGDEHQCNLIPPLKIMTRTSNYINYIKCYSISWNQRLPCMPLHYTQYRLHIIMLMHAFRLGHLGLQFTDRWIWRTGMGACRRHMHSPWAGIVFIQSHCSIIMLCYCPHLSKLLN